MAGPRDYEDFEKDYSHFEEWDEVDFDEDDEEDYDNMSDLELEIAMEDL